MVTIDKNWVFDGDKKMAIGPKMGGDGQECLGK
jgi:hypothetical protein